MERSTFNLIKPFSIPNLFRKAKPLSTMTASSPLTAAAPAATSKPVATNTPVLSADALIAMAKTRRSYYALGKNIPVPTTRIHDIVRETTLHTPSAFNSQTTRTLVLSGAAHDKLWDMTTSILRAHVADDKWAPTAARMAGFRGAAGTVLFFEDQTTVGKMQDKFPQYRDGVPTWAAQSDGMQQWLTWTALELEGMGANLQHYGPVIEESVKEEWGVPESWSLTAQLVFGELLGEARVKDFEPVEDRMKVFGEA